MIQLILQRLLGDDLAPLTHGAQTPQVAGGIERRVRRLGEVDLGQMRRHGGQRALEAAETGGRGAAVALEAEGVGADALDVAVFVAGAAAVGVAHEVVVAVGVVRVEAGRVFGERPRRFGLPGKQTHHDLCARGASLVVFALSLLFLSSPAGARAGCLLGRPRPTDQCRQTGRAKEDNDGTRLDGESRKDKSDRKDKQDKQDKRDKRDKEDKEGRETTTAAIDQLINQF